MEGNVIDTYKTISYTFEFQPALTRYIPTGWYFPHAINDFGQVVGDFTLRGPSVGFLYDAGTVRTDVVTGSLRFSYLGGINDTDQFTGSVVTPDGALEAILISHGVLQAFTYPGSTAMEGHGINNWGQVVGDYTDAGGTHGFVETPDHLSAIDVPDGSHTVAYAINDWRQIVGSYQGADGHQHGFLDTGGHYARINVPGAQTISVTGINDWGQIVGYYDDGASHRHGFVRTGGQFQTLDVSGASVTSAMGINNLGEIVGYADFPGAEGFPPQAQVWVARPSFIHDPSSAGTALSEPVWLSFSYEGGLL